MSKIIAFIKKETILSIAWLLAILSAFLVHPSVKYLGYIDFRSLGILWSMMIIMEGLKQNGFFDLVGKKLLTKTKGTLSLILILVFLCYFFSMLITNDVALLTFVPFTMYILKTCGKLNLLVPVVVLQTLAANLGSMLTPIGNPQNLYLYGISEMSLPDFLGLMFPYSAMTAVLLLISAILLAGRSKGSIEVDMNHNEGGFGSKSHTLIYGILFLAALLVVVRILPFPVLVAIVLVVVFFMERGVFGNVDYALLMTFVGFFIFTGNMGEMPSIARALTELVADHEVVLGVAMSQVISNVPAALLLSGFTENYADLILGVNLGGLGTLIASMASLISFKFVAHSYNDKKGRFFLVFTAMNILYLIILMVFWAFIK